MRFPGLTLSHALAAAARLLAVALLGLMLAFTPVAAATTTGAGATTSANWSGYAVHAPGVSFTRARGTWTIPRADCSAGSSTYSAAWVGIGGYALSAPALEQIGTETNCTRSGRMTTAAWYEIVPSPSRRLDLVVKPGDTLTATVAVIGHRVVLTLRDVTRHRAVTKSLTPRTVDVGSAEWIVEAPERCVGGTECRTLPLADFGAVTFRGAGARDTAGASGSIRSGHWTRTKITLAQSGHRFVSGAALAAAVPSALSASGKRFRVTYAGRSVTPTASATQMGTRAVTVTAGPPQPGGRRR